MSYRLQQSLKGRGFNLAEESERAKVADHLYSDHGAITETERWMADPEKLQRKHDQEHGYSSLNTPEHFALAPELHR